METRPLATALCFNPIIGSRWNGCCRRMTCRAVIQEQHVQKRFVKFNTLHTHIAPALSMILPQQRKHHSEAGTAYWAQIWQFQAVSCMQFFVHSHKYSDEKDRRFVRISFSSLNKNPTFLYNNITSDDTWCFLYNPQTKLEMTWWKSPSYLWKIKCLPEGDAWDIFWQQKYHTQGIHSCSSYNYWGMVCPRTMFSMRCNPPEAARHVVANSWMSLHPCLVGTDKSWKCPTMPTTFSRHHPMWLFSVCTAE
jgi:hypothetical protein